MQDGQRESSTRGPVNKITGGKIYKDSVDRHIMMELTKKIADAVNSKELDSPYEDNILEKWVKQEKIPDTSVNVVGKGTYPATSQLTNRIILNKEVRLGSYRIDCIAYWYKSAWKLIEVKEKSQVGPSVVGDLLVKSKIFENKFMVNPSRVEKIILSDEIPDEYCEVIEQINTEYNTSIQLAELQ